MDKTLMKVILAKAYKIQYYEQHPQSDESYLKLSKKLNRMYEKAKEEYLRTSDKKYKKLMQKIEEAKTYNVSKTEYENSKEDLKQFREKYCNEFGEDFWDLVDFASDEEDKEKAADEDGE